MRPQFRTRLAQTVVIGFVLICVLVGLGLVTASATAQELPGDQPTPTPTPNGTDSGERIQTGLELLSSEYDGEGSATLKFRVTGAPVAVTITDAGAFQRGGEIDRRTVVLDEGTHTVEMPVTESPNGLVGVTIGTNEVLYAEPIKTETDLFESESTWGLVQTAGLGGAVGVVIVAGLISWRLRTGGKNRVQRQA